MNEKNKCLKVWKICGRIIGNKIVCYLEGHKKRNKYVDVESMAWLP